MQKQYLRTNTCLLLFLSGIVSLCFTAFHSPVSMAKENSAQAMELPGCVFHSTDYGIEWMPDNNGIADQRVNALEIDPQNPLTLYAGTRRGIFKTTDGGSHWENSGGFTTLYVISTLAIDPVTPATVYAAGNGTGGNYVFKSIDAGISWKAISLGFNNSALASLQMNPKDRSIIYVRDELRLYKSSDSGEQWNIILTVPGFDDFSTPTDYKIDPLNPSTIYMAVAHSFYKTTDSGNNWVEMSQVFYDMGVRPWGVTINPMNSSEIYVVTDEGKAVKSTDGGGSWNFLENQSPISIYNLTIDPAATAFYTTVMADRRRTLFKSVDGGKSWFATGLISAQTIIDLSEKYDLKFHPLDPLIIYVGSNGGLQIPDSPWIKRFMIEGKRLLVSGENFDTGAVILLDGEVQPTKNDGFTPKMKLIGKTAGKRVRKHPELKIQIKNANGKLSQEVTIWPPLN